MIFARVCRHLRGTGAFVLVVRGHDPDVRVVSAVGVRRRAVAGEGDACSVGRPRRLVVVKIARRDLGQRLCCQVQNIKMGAAMIQIPDRVSFELQPIYHPGFWRLCLLLFGGAVLILIFIFVLRLFDFFGLRIAKHQYEPSAVGRPVEIVYILWSVRGFLRFAAQAIQQPDLNLPFVPRGKERQVSAVRTPAGMG